MEFKTITVKNGTENQNLKIYSCSITNIDILESDPHFIFGGVIISVDGMDKIVNEWANYYSEFTGYPIIIADLMNRVKLKKPIRYISKKDRQSVLDKFNHNCKFCGSEKDLHIDHIIPISKGGKNNITNLQVLCRTCNLKKGDKIL